MKLDFAYTTPPEVISLVMGRAGNEIVPSEKIAELVRQDIEQKGLTTDQTIFYMPEAGMSERGDFCITGDRKRALADILASETLMTDALRELTYEEKVFLLYRAGQFLIDLNDGQFGTNTNVDSIISNVKVIKKILADEEPVQLLHRSVEKTRDCVSAALQNLGYTVVQPAQDQCEMLSAPESITRQWMKVRGKDRMCKVKPLRYSDLEYRHMALPDDENLVREEITAFPFVRGRSTLVTIAPDLSDVKTLEELSKELTPRQKLKIICDAMRGYQAGHEAGYCHFDPKPENIAVSHNDDGKVVGKAFDFETMHEQGDAVNLMYTWFYSDTIFFANSLHGYPHQKNDVYGLGVTLLESLGGNTHLLEHYFKHVVPHIIRSFLNTDKKSPADFLAHDFTQVHAYESIKQHMTVIRINDRECLAMASGKYFVPVWPLMNVIVEVMKTCAAPAEFLRQNEDIIRVLIASGVPLYDENQRPLYREECEALRFDSVLKRWVELMMHEVHSAFLQRFYDDQSRTQIMPPLSAEASMVLIVGNTAKIKAFDAYYRECLRRDIVSGTLPAALEPIVLRMISFDRDSRPSLGECLKTLLPLCDLI